MTEAQKVRYAERQKYGMSDVQKKEGILWNEADNYLKYENFESKVILYDPDPPFSPNQKIYDMFNRIGWMMQSEWCSKKKA